MDRRVAEEHLQVIRTLMERAALYRRTLAPIMTLLGMLALAAAVAGWGLGLRSVRAFAFYWMGVSAVAVVAVFGLARRQALKAGEAFFSPPTRRVTQSILPTLFVGLVCGLVFAGLGEAEQGDTLLALIWTFLYGCALHSAGFFTPRGLKLFGWVFLACGSVTLLALVWMEASPPPGFGHVLMGLFFGAMQLAYGAYLYVTESGRKEA